MYRMDRVSWTVWYVTSAVSFRPMMTADLSWILARLQNLFNISLKGALRR